MTPGLQSTLRRAVMQAPIFDLHTHLFPPEFGDLCLSGVDSLLDYHYLAAETLRCTRGNPSNYAALSMERRAELVWNELFVKRSPLSEASSGVVTSLQALGRRTTLRSLQGWRNFLARKTPEQRVDRVLALAGVESLVMTNDPSDARELKFWASGRKPDPRFRASLRLDPIFGASTVPKGGAGRFVRHWTRRMGSLYCAASLGPDFKYPARNRQAALLDREILPLLRELGQPLALMLGVKRGLNPKLGAAGDGSGRADLSSVAALCARWPNNRFMLTVLSDENQHEAAVLARKFGNLMLFGCWWFCNTPSQIRRLTLLRLELLGTSFVPQHSDARVLEQLIYKWRHSRRAIFLALQERYAALEEEGWKAGAGEIRRDVDALFRGNIRNFTSGSGT